MNGISPQKNLSRREGISREESQLVGAIHHPEIMFMSQKRKFAAYEKKVRDECMKVGELD